MKIFGSFLVLIFGFNSVLSCGFTSCVSFRNLNDYEYKKELTKVDAIFFGEIISQSELFDAEKGFPYRILRVKVSNIWKGIDINTREIEVKFHYYDSDCAVLGESGKRMFYSGYVIDKVTLETGQCALSNFDDEKTKKILGEGKIVEESNQVSQQVEISQSFWSIIWQKVFSFFS